MTRREFKAHAAQRAQALLDMIKQDPDSMLIATVSVTPQTIPAGVGVDVTSCPVCTDEALERFTLSL